MQDIMADTNVTDEQHAANWAQIPQYLGRLTEHDLDAHVPFWTRHMGCVGSAVP